MVLNSACQADGRQAHGNWMSTSFRKTAKLSGEKLIYTSKFRLQTQICISAVISGNFSAVFDLDSSRFPLTEHSRMWKLALNYRGRIIFGKCLT